MAKSISLEGVERVEIRDVRPILTEIIEREGVIGLMKIDCEGCEWELFECLDKAILDHVSALYLEIHGGDSGRLLSTLRNSGFVLKEETPVENEPVLKCFLERPERDAEAILKTVASNSAETM